MDNAGTPVLQLFNFSLAVERDDGPMWLSLTGGEGVKEFLQAEISARQR